MQKLLVPALSFLLGLAVATIIALALVIYGSSLAERQHALNKAQDPAPPPSLGTVNSSSPSGRAGTLSSSPASGRPGTLPAQYARAWELLNAGHPREAQDAFLAILSSDPEDPHAMQGLVAVRRAMGPNPTELRRQAGAYRDAVRRGADMGDHYTPSAMEALAAASERAAEEIEALSGSAPVTLTAPPMQPAHLPRSPGQKDTGKGASGGNPPATTAHAAKPHGPPAPPSTADPAKNPVDKTPVAPAPRTPAPPAPVPQASPPPPAPAPQTAPSPPPAAAVPQVSPPPPVPAPQIAPPPPAPAPQTSAPPPSAAPRVYMVRVGPVASQDWASTIAKELSAKGFSQAKVFRDMGPLFQVVSEPLPPTVAESLTATLAGRGLASHVERLAGDAAHVVFGAFTSQSEADALSRRVSALGYDAWVAREGAAYTLELGPYPQSSVDSIAGIIKSSAPDAAVTTELVP